MSDISTVPRNTWDNMIVVTRDGSIDQTWDGKTKNLVYDVGTLSWVAETQPTGAAGGGGDASAANQTTEIAKLTSIDGKLGSLGQKTMAASAPVVIASDQPSLPVTASAGTNLNTSALNLETTQSAMSAKLPASLGAKTTTASLAVNIASDQIVPVSGTVTANAGTNLNTSALNLESTQSAMSGKLPATLGQKAMTASLAVALASDQTSIPVAATLQAGAALVGKVGLDQTTPGTTNKVSIGTDGTVAVTSSALPTGAALDATLVLGNATVTSISALEANTIAPLLQSILTELKILTAFVGAGLNVKDDPEQFRNDLYYQ